MTITFKAVEKMAGAERFLFPVDCALETGSLTVHDDAADGGTGPAECRAHL